jgi:hypothetical protein
MDNGWKDRGLIIDLDLINQQSSTNFEWAQGPQILNMKTHLRLYFSTRVRDEDSQPVSKVCYVDFSPGFREILGEIREVKIQEGLLGGFDQHGIFPFHPYAIGNNFFMALTCGWKRMQSVDIDMSIGQAISLDGEHFARNGYGPLVSAGPSEPFLIGDPFVHRDNDIYSLFYIFGTKWSEYDGRPERTYKIGKMKSSDGFAFVRDNPGKQIVPDTIKNEAQAMPTVIQLGESYHMFYSYRNSFDFRDGGTNGYRLGHAMSANGEDWKLKHSVLPSTFPDWSRDMQCYPHVTVVDSELYLFFNGNQFGKNGVGLMTKEIGAFDVT